jgi:RNA polymerase sigma-70 factor (ECF subfamily)
MYRIILSVARDAGRRRRRESRNGWQPLHPDDPGPVDGHAAPQEAASRREEAELVGRALAELPEPLRQVLVLRHYEGLSFEDIARLTDTPASTLKSRFAAALERLRQRLHPLGRGPEENAP